MSLRTGSETIPLSACVCGLHQKSFQSSSFSRFSFNTLLMIFPAAVLGRDSERIFMYLGTLYLARRFWQWAMTSASGSRTPL